MASILEQCNKVQVRSLRGRVFDLLIEVERSLSFKKSKECAELLYKAGIMQKQDFDLLEGGVIPSYAVIFGDTAKDVAVSYAGVENARV